MCRMSTQTAAPARPLDTFAARAALIRHDAGNLDYREAAARIGVSYTTWRNWEHGVIPANFPEIAELIEQEFGYERDWVLWGGPLPAPERPRPVSRDRANNRRANIDTPTHGKSTRYHSPLPIAA